MSNVTEESNQNKELSSLKEKVEKSKRNINNILSIYNLRGRHDDMMKLISEYSENCAKYKVEEYKEQQKMNNGIAEWPELDSTRISNPEGVTKGFIQFAQGNVSKKQQWNNVNKEAEVYVGEWTIYGKVVKLDKIDDSRLAETGLVRVEWRDEDGRTCSAAVINDQIKRY